MSQRRKYTNEQFIKAVKISKSYRQVLFKIGLVAAGGNYESIKKLIVQLNLDTSHFKGKGWNKGIKKGPKRPIEDYLSNKANISSWKLKNKLLREHIFQPKCSNCNLEKWLEKPIPLELHHKNGNSHDNSLNNLELLCPNCHALTPNYRSKNTSFIT